MAGLSGAAGLGGGIAWAVYATQERRSVCEPQAADMLRCPDNPHFDAQLLAGTFGLVGTFAAAGLVIPGSLFHGRYAAYQSRQVLDTNQRKIVPIATGAGLLAVGGASLLLALASDALASSPWEAGPGLAVAGGALSVAGIGALSYGVTRARWQRRYATPAQLGAAPIYDRRSGLMGVGVSGRF